MIRVGVVSLGAPHHGNIFANNMNKVMKHYKFEHVAPSREYGWAHINPRELDVLWFYGFHGLPDQLISKFKEDNPKLKVIVTWVGSDILEFGQFSRYRPGCAQCIIKNVDIHVADGQNLVREMDQFFGIKPIYIPSIPDTPLELTPLPEKFAVAVYCPGFRADFFNYPLIRNVAEKLPEVPFNLFGGGPVGLPNAELDGDKVVPNLLYLGWVEGEVKKKWWKESSVLLYMPKHGSLGVTGVEFLQMGRYVICSQEYPFVIECKTEEDLLSALTGLKDVKEPHVEASKYYLAEFSVEKQGEKVGEILDKI